jgi:phospholipid/cholesterol/gamma-HCH transport system permease protein
LAVHHDSSDGAVLELAGPWQSQHGLAEPSGLLDELRSRAIRHVAFDARQITAWDSGLVTFVLKVLREAAQLGIDADRAGLLTAFSGWWPWRRPSLNGRPGAATRGRHGWPESEPAPSQPRGVLGGTRVPRREPAGVRAFLRGRARFRGSDLLVVIQDCGPRALGIVTLISFLIGLILAFVGAVQLQQFGASIFVANLVAIAMTREIGCIMTAIVMSGRTGAAFAAQLGTMNTNQEIDALATLGISPMEFLVLPRMLALIAMMPLLTVYADLVGILGGAVVGIGMLGLGPMQYLEQTRDAVHASDFLIGIAKSVVFGVIVALAGCLRGMQSGRSASAVGLAATSAVVTSIVLLIVLDGMFAVILNVLGF